MTKAKKLTAEALAEAARNGGAAAVSALIDEIVKDAPRIPGLVALEEEYGVGNIPMLAVHESKLLSLEDKTLLFQIAGFKYDGTAPAKPAVDPLQGLRDSGFIKLQQAMAMAYDADGFTAVMGLLKKFQVGAAKTERDIGIWATTEFDGLTYLADKYEGSTAKLSKYQFLHDGFNANHFPDDEEEADDELADHFYTETVESYESLIYHDTVGALAGYPFDCSEKQLANREAIRAWGLAELPDFKLSAKRLKDAVALAPELRSKLAVAAQKVEM
jgi:hypothetical protein